MDRRRLNDAPTICTDFDSVPTFVAEVDVDAVGDAGGAQPDLMHICFLLKGLGLQQFDTARQFRCGRSFSRTLEQIQSEPVAEFLARDQVGLAMASNEDVSERYALPVVEQLERRFRRAM
jgi:hypothetical protein